MKPSRPAAYLRISDDVELLGEGVGRQRADVTALAERLGWPTPLFYVDNDRSAFKAGVVREEWCRLLADLESGLIDGLLAYNLDRVVRQPVELEALIRLVEGKIPTHAASGIMDLSNDAGITVARMMVGFANLESRSIARRVKRKHAEIAEQGRPGGGQRPYGFEDDRISHRANEAAVVVEVANRVHAGESLHSVMIDLNERGIRPPRAKAWRAGSLKAILKAPRTGGYRELDGVLTEAVWEPLIDRAQWRAIREMLGSRAGSPGVTARKHLLSGFLVCADCTAPLRINNHPSGLRYACPPSTQGGCGGPSRKAALLEEAVDEWVRMWLAEISLESEPEEDPAEAKLERLQARIATLDRAYKAEDIEDVDYFRHLKALRAEIRETSRTIRATRPVLSDDPVAAWESANLSQRRATLARYIEVIKVGRVIDRAAHRNSLEFESLSIVRA